MRVIGDRGSAHLLEVIITRRSNESKVRDGEESEGTRDARREAKETDSLLIKNPSWCDLGEPARVAVRGYVRRGRRTRGRGLVVCEKLPQNWPS